MSQLLLAPPARKQATAVTYDELDKIEVPEATESWQPVSHARVLDMVTDSMESLGFRIQGRTLIVARYNQQFFGTLDLESYVTDGVKLSVGVRNSINKTLSAGLVFGETVLVCSNLCFFGERSLFRKHTSNIERDLHVKIRETVASLRQYREASKERIELLRSRSITDTEADSLILRAYEQNLVGSRMLPRFIEEWRQPRYDDFSQRNRWSLLNCFTELYHERHKEQPIAASQETMAFQKFLCA
ncbi:hypothetical protein Pan258_01690 [Symmachiella dynata]|uniref:DUF932 domain-containing protein n=1 Tax=Symmachiella dynata TaxID=2527995 RepID=UPI001187E782|nr:DUF932 domain-containing protein [Symmachiella dynata]QDT46152.1 hypothetical protein Pan258_01690 [Symmachiella dynata]